MVRLRRIPTLGSWGMALALLLGAFFAGTPAQALFKPHNDARHEVEQLEEQWRVAQLAGDLATLDGMLSDDYVGITMSGQVNTKAQQLDRIRKHVFVLTRLDLNEVKVKLVENVAIVTVMARVEGTNESRRFSGDFRYTRIYQHLPSGEWKITNFEATRVHTRKDEAHQAAS